jgi:hypothetical protein
MLNEQPCDRKFYRFDSESWLKDIMVKWKVLENYPCPRNYLQIVWMSCCRMHPLYIRRRI